MKFFYTCPECGEETEVEAVPVTPAKIWGPPEDCYPEEGGECEPDECPHCGEKWDVANLHEKAADAHERNFDDRE